MCIHYRLLFTWVRSRGASPRRLARQAAQLGSPPTPVPSAAEGNAISRPLSTGTLSK